MMIPVDEIFKHLSKVFDAVYYLGLTLKLGSLIIHNEIRNWEGEFLSDRRPWVRIYGTLSIRSGDP